MVLALRRSRTAHCPNGAPARAARCPLGACCVANGRRAERAEDEVARLAAQVASLQAELMDEVGPPGAKRSVRKRAVPRDSARRAM